MNKYQTTTVIITSAFFMVFLPIFGLYVYDWYNNYRESLNNFALTDVCKIEKGMDIDTAWNILGRPVEYHNYNFSNVYSAQYRNINKNYFLEIYYTTEKGTITEVFWGRGRTKTLAESGVCPIKTANERTSSTARRCTRPSASPFAAPPHCASGGG